MGNKNAGCLSIFFPFLKLFAKNSAEKEVFPYAKRDDFLSPAELSFYKVLRQAVGEEIMICPKVGLKDIFFVKSKDRSTYMTYHNKIDRKHVDFLLCRFDTLEPICGIELDDSSHQKQSRVERDSFVDEVFNIAQLPLLRVKHKRSYVLTDIKEKLYPILNVEDSSRNNARKENVDQEGIPLCPKCGIPMVKRTVSRGENKGKEFYGCSNFPKCREIKEFVKG